ncbi:MAG: hypothetical protein IT447_01400 [Phycisphaerales bacterium]|nr:hypothetical protein [Phycisphaerales bacterium]
MVVFLAIIPMMFCVAMPSRGSTPAAVMGYQIEVVGDMERVGPQAADFDPSAREKRAEIWTARQEHESIQVVILAGDHSLTDVHISWTELKRDDSSDVLAQESITCYVVDFVPDNPKR